MGKGCMKAIKYFLFLFNVLFFLFGALIMGFGLWVLLDKESFMVILPVMASGDADPDESSTNHSSAFANMSQSTNLCSLIMGFGLWVLLDKESFMVILQESSTVLKIASYILIGVGGLSMLMGFLGCLGAIYEIRCLLGLYFTCLLLILIGQVAAGVLIYFQKDLLNKEMSNIVTQILSNYPGKNSTTEQAWDYIQRTGCNSSVESWLFANVGVILGVCLGVAVIELLGMILSIGLCKSIHTEDYTKVPKY